MCAGAIVQARLARVIFGARDPKCGAIVSLYNVLSDERLNHQVEVTEGILREECGEILSRFFREKRIKADSPDWYDAERYRSGRNGIDSKSIWGPQAPTGVRIPLSPPEYICYFLMFFVIIRKFVERCPSGWRSTTGNRVYAPKGVPRVQIPLSPPFFWDILSLLAIFYKIEYQIDSYSFILKIVHEYMWNFCKK